MLIDWFTVVAQGVNFLALVWLLQRFLYRPVLAAIDSRERQVAAVLADANAKQDDARRERDELGEKLAAFDQQRAALWATASAAAETERRRLLDEASHAAMAANSKRADALRDEALALQQAIGRRVQHEVFAVARQTLAELADTTLESRVCAVFVGRLQALDGPAREGFVAAIRAEPGPVRVRSAFDLGPAERAALQLAANEAFSADVRLAFDKSPDIVSGIELTVGGHRIDWSIASQIEALSSHVADWVEPPRFIATDARADAGAGDDTTPTAGPLEPADAVHA